MQPPPRNEVTWESAIASLQAMFPTYDLAVIETFLELNRGKVETTVEQLLAMDAGGGGAPPAAAAAGAPAPPPQHQQHQQHQQQHRQPPPPPRHAAGAPPATPPWRQPLPADFLVLPAPILERFAGAESQLAADQRMAEMLQSALGGPAASGGGRTALCRAPL